MFVADLSRFATEIKTNRSVYNDCEMLRRLLLGASH